MTDKGKAGKRTILIMKRSKNGKFNNRSYAYMDTFRWDRAFYLGIIIGLVILYFTIR